MTYRKIAIYTACGAAALAAATFALPRHVSIERSALIDAAPASASADQVVFALDLGPLGQPTQAISAVAEGGATKVVWSMDMDLGANPLFRVMGLFMDGMIGPNFELGLANIADVAA